MQQAFKAGILYFTGAFALGFLFGGLRLMLLVPTLGELWAVLLEVPVMLALLWLLCRRAIEILAVPGSLAPRAVMGLTALSFLLVAELVLSQLMFGNTPAQYLAGFTTAAGAVGLAGQVLFATFPLIQLRRVN